MKKCLTVLLVIAVMFTFSFGSAFAAAPAAGNIVETKEAAVAKITDKADGFISDVTADLNKLISDYEANKGTAGDVSKEAYSATLEAEAEKAVNTLKAQKVNALNALEEAEKKVSASGSILGYSVGEATTEPGYVDVFTILETIKDPDFASTNLSGLESNFVSKEFDLVKEATLKDIQAVNPADYSMSDNYNNTGKSSYQTAADVRSAALVAVNAIKVDSGDNASAIKGKIAEIKAIFEIQNKGTAGETYAGSEGSKLIGLKKTTTEMTDEKKIEYAKSYALTEVKSMIEKEKADKIGAQNAIIFAQELSAKPNQSVIDAAKKEIDRLTKEYDALLEVWNYRLNNADYKVRVNSAKTAEYIEAYYNDAKIFYVGYFAANVFHMGTGDNSLESIAKLNSLLPKTAVQIVEIVDELEKEAANLSGTIMVDGDVYVNVDQALAKAVKIAYMTGNKATLSASSANYEAHDRVHELLGADNTKVTVDGKKYDTVYAWDDKISAYDDTKADEIKALIKDTEKNLKETETVTDANAAFLDAYAKFDAIPTKAEHDAMFVYGGTLYDAYTKAVAEINAYVSYKAEVMGDNFPGNVTTLKNYFTAKNTGVLWKDVYSADDLNTKVAEAKATIDALKTKKEMRDQESALNAKLVDVKVPVTLDVKDSINALYNEVKDFINYSDMVGYTEGITLSGLPTTYVKNIAALEKEAMDKIVDKIYTDGKITLDDKADIESLITAAEAYTKLYVDEMEVSGITEPTFTYVGKISSQKASYFEKELFNLEVEAAEALIKSLPANGASSAQIKAAKEAVKALGFNGICEIDRNLLAKLNRLDQNLMYEVEALKITASSSATKGAMTIKWKVKGDTSAVEAFEIWRSTKKSSGFQKFFTTTNGEKRTYKNTKNLKKGTRYYYKVRAIAYDIDGNKITSDWSNKAYRIAK